MDQSRQPPQPANPAANSQHHHVLLNEHLPRPTRPSRPATSHSTEVNAALVIPDRRSQSTQTPVNTIPPNTGRQSVQAIPLNIVSTQPQPAAASSSTAAIPCILAANQPSSQPSPSLHPPNNVQRLPIPSDRPASSPHQVASHQQLAALSGSPPQNISHHHHEHAVMMNQHNTSSQSNAAQQQQQRSSVIQRAPSAAPSPSTLPPTRSIDNQSHSSAQPTASTTCQPQPQVVPLVIRLDPLRFPGFLFTDNISLPANMEEDHQNIYAKAAMEIENAFSRQQQQQLNDEDEDDDVLDRDLHDEALEVAKKIKSASGSVHTAPNAERTATAAASDSDDWLRSPPRLVIDLPEEGEGKVKTPTPAKSSQPSHPPQMANDQPKLTQRRSGPIATKRPVKTPPHPFEFSDISDASDDEDDNATEASASRIPAATEQRALTAPTYQPTKAANPPPSQAATTQTTIAIPLKKRRRLQSPTPPPPVEANRIEAKSGATINGPAPSAPSGTAAAQQQLEALYRQSKWNYLLAESAILRNAAAASSSGQMSSSPANIQPSHQTPLSNTPNRQQPSASSSSYAQLYQYALQQPQHPSTSQSQTYSRTMQPNAAEMSLNTPRHTPQPTTNGQRSLSTLAPMRFSLPSIEPSRMNAITNPNPLAVEQPHQPNRGKEKLKSKLQQKYHIKAPTSEDFSAAYGRLAYGPTSASRVPSTASPAVNVGSPLSLTVPTNAIPSPSPSSSRMLSLNSPAMRTNEDYSAVNEASLHSLAEALGRQCPARQRQQTAERRQAGTNGTTTQPSIVWAFLPPSQQQQQQQSQEQNPPRIAVSQNQFQIMELLQRTPNRTIANHHHYHVPTASNIPAPVISSSQPTPTFNHGGPSYHPCHVNPPPTTTNIRNANTSTTSSRRGRPLLASATVTQSSQPPRSSIPPFSCTSTTSAQQAAAAFRAQNGQQPSNGVRHGQAVNHPQYAAHLANFNQPIEASGTETPHHQSTQRETRKRGRPRGSGKPKESGSQRGRPGRPRGSGRQAQNGLAPTVGQQNGHQMAPNAPPLNHHQPNANIRNPIAINFQNMNHYQQNHQQHQPASSSAMPIEPTRQRTTTAENTNLLTLCSAAQMLRR